MFRSAAVAVVGLMILAACSAGSDPAVDPSDVGPPPTLPQRLSLPTPDLDAVPMLDLSVSIVDPPAIVYDTFDGSFLALGAASAGQVRGLRDRIKPIYVPEYQAAVRADAWLDDADRVIGIEADGVAFAYPTRILSFREIVKRRLTAFRRWLRIARYAARESYSIGVLQAARCCSATRPPSMTMTW